METPETIPLRPEHLLRAAALRLKTRGPGQSLRAVAGRLKISPSYWSKILRGEKPLSQQLLPRVVRILGLDAHQVAQLQRAILDTIERDQLEPATGLRTSATLDSPSPVANYQHLGHEEFWILEEWYYIPILNLFTLDGFAGDAAEVSARLGLRAEIATKAVHRLTAGGFLTVGENQRLERSPLPVRFPTDRSYRHVRKYHQAMLQKAADVLTRDNSAATFESRLISAVCFAGSSAKLREARLLLEEAMYRAANLMAEAPVSDEVYQVNVQVFPLTRPKK